MIQQTFQEEQEVISATKYHPSVSIILPFETQLSSKTKLKHKLKMVVDKAKKELLNNYTNEKATPVIDKLLEIANSIDLTRKAKKSIAIYVSPLLVKVIYLDIIATEKMVIDESFEIRDLVQNKKALHKYLLLVLSAKHTTILLGNTSHLTRIVSYVPDNIAAYKNDTPEKVANFSDASSRKETLLNKFLKRTDAGLGLILNTYQLPLFIMGTKRTAGHFKKVSAYSDRISGIIHGNFEETPDHEILKIMIPHITEWEKTRQSKLLQKLDTAMSEKKLATGIKDVWKNAANKKGRLLVVEKNYVFPARAGRGQNSILGVDNIEHNSLYIHDAVDDVIEKVLSNGGDIEFMEDGSLSNYGQIALIEYY